RGRITGNETGNVRVRRSRACLLTWRRGSSHSGPPGMSRPRVAFISGSVPCDRPPMSIATAFPSLPDGAGPNSPADFGGSGSSSRISAGMGSTNGAVEKNFTPLVRAFLDYLKLERHFSDYTVKSY